MSQITPTNPTCNTWDWNLLAQWVKDPLCAGAAVFPIVPLFILKSTLQAQALDGVNRKSLKQICASEFNSKTVVPVLKDTCKASGALTIALGVQLALTHFFENIWMNHRQNPRFDNVMNAGAIPTVVAGLTTPFLIGFNGLTNKKGFIKSIYNITPRKYIATVIREMFFLGSVQISRVASNNIKDTVGDNYMAKHASNFVVGWLGAAFGHNADTYLTLLQHNKLNAAARLSLRQSYAGFHARTIAVGLFNVLFQQFKSIANEQIEKRKLKGV